MPNFDSDKAMSICGVAGRLTHRTTKPGQAPGLWCNQRWISEARPISGYGPGAVIRAEIRFDDECGNGHNSFAVTADIYRLSGKGKYGGRRIDIAGGCCHDDIAHAFPELAHLIRWHLFDSSGPMHYVANTVYHAGNRDHNGLRKGEQRQRIAGQSRLPMWELVAVNSDGVGFKTKEPCFDATVPVYRLETLCIGDAPTLATPKLEWRPCYVIGEGKARDLAAARSTAVWPEATDEQLSAEPEVLKAALLARLPALVTTFRADIEAAGLLWSPEGATETAPDYA